MKLFNNKRCPRCNTKVPLGVGVCPSCMLNFQKFDDATNKDAKIAIKQGEKNNVLMRKGCPKDVSKTKLLLLTIFLGFVGAHHYYVGRYKMGVFYTIFFIIGLINAILRTTINAAFTGIVLELFSLLVLVWGAVLFMWIVDISKVCFNKYKIPVSRS